MKISLLHPSRSRPDKAYATATKWKELAGVEVEHIISLDKSDKSVFEGLYKNNFKWENHTDSVYIVNDNSCVVEATNHAAKVATGDLLLYLSDDFDCFENWGVKVVEQFKEENRPLLIKCDDGLQAFHVPVLTIPIMNRSLYEKLGYFWHPEYKSMFCDEHLYWTSMKLGALKMCPSIKFQHNHPCIGKAEDDETYRRSAANWDQGKALFNLHKSQGFPI